MKLTYFVAKWSWSSLFVFLWLRAFGYMGGEPALTWAALLIFGGLALLSTLIYAGLLHRIARYNIDAYLS